MRCLLLFQAKKHITIYQEGGQVFITKVQPGFDSNVKSSVLVKKLTHTA